jgi:Tol biopolymer transport system component
MDPDGKNMAHINQPKLTWFGDLGYGYAAYLQPTSTDMPDPEGSPNAVASPVCGGSGSLPTSTTHPNDGVPDPDGRVVFGPLTGANDVAGQFFQPLYAVDADGTDLTVVLDCQISRPRVSRDGTRIAFWLGMDDDSWQLATSAIDGSDLQVLTSYKFEQQTEKSGTPDWTADGSQLVFANNHTIWLMDADGSDAHLIGPADGFDAEPRVSPDGTQIVYLHGDFTKGVSEPYILDLATGEVHDLTPSNRRELEHPDWSPDGQWIVYNTPTDETGEHLEQIERVRADSRDGVPEVLVGDPTHTAYKPAYSPDGMKMTFGCDDRICIADADGENVTVLVEAPDTHLNHPAWAPLASGEMP